MTQVEFKAFCSTMHYYLFINQSNTRQLVAQLKFDLDILLMLGCLLNRGMLGPSLVCRVVGRSKADGE